MNEKQTEETEFSAGNSLMVIEQGDIGIDDIGHIEFSGLSKLKSNLFGGYNKESVLDIIDKIIEQTEAQLADMKRYLRIQEERNAVLRSQNDSLQEEIYKLMCQIKEDQEDFSARTVLKDEQIELLQRENQQLRERIKRDKRAVLERLERQLDTRKTAETPDEVYSDEQLTQKRETVEDEIRKLNTQELIASEAARAHAQEAAASQPKRLQVQVKELLNSGALSRENLEKPVTRPKEIVPAETSRNNIIVLPGVAELPNLTSGGDKNWDLDSILKEYGE